MKKSFVVSLLSSFFLMNDKHVCFKVVKFSYSFIFDNFIVEVFFSFAVCLEKGNCLPMMIVESDQEDDNLRYIQKLCFSVLLSENCQYVIKPEVILVSYQYMQL